LYATLRRKRVLIDLTLGELRQQFVRALLFFEALMQQLLVIAQLELPGERGDAPVSRNLS
jgi:hypothetical protein